MAKMAKISCLLYYLSRFKITSQFFFCFFERYCDVLQNVTFSFFVLSFYRMATLIVIDETIWVFLLTLVRRPLCLYYLSSSNQQSKENLEKEPLVTEHKKCTLVRTQFRT